MLRGMLLNHCSPYRWIFVAAEIVTSDTGKVSPPTLTSNPLKLKENSFVNYTWYPWIFSQNLMQPTSSKVTLIDGSEINKVRSCGSNLTISPPLCFFLSKVVMIFTTKMNSKVPWMELGVYQLSIENAVVVMKWSLD